LLIQTNVSLLATQSSDPSAGVSIINQLNKIANQFFGKIKVELPKKTALELFKKDIERGIIFTTSKDREYKKFKLDIRKKDGR